MSTSLYVDTIIAFVPAQCQTLSIERLQYEHQIVNHSAKQFVDGMAHTNGIESVWAVLKRGFYGVYHSFSEKHLQRYVDEFAFRLNDGNCKVHTLDRIAATLGRTAGVRVTYTALTQ